jgi:transcriptional regulator with XRE-family HTH domain
MEMDYYKIGQRIRKIRKARGISQEKLAGSVGISVSHMSHIETADTKLSLPVLVSLAESLEVRTDELLYDSTPMIRNDALKGILDVLQESPTDDILVIEDVVRTLAVSLKKKSKQE